MYISFYICIFCFWKANSSLSHLWDLNWQQEGNRKGLPKQKTQKFALNWLPLSEMTV